MKYISFVLLALLPLFSGCSSSEVDLRNLYRVVQVRTYETDLTEYAVVYLERDRGAQTTDYQLVVIETAAFGKNVKVGDKYYLRLLRPGGSK